MIDGLSDAVTRTIPLGTHPQAIAVDEQNDRVYVANQRTGSMTVIDGKTKLPVSKVDVGTIPYAIGLDAPARVIYVANYGSNNVSVIR